MTPKSEVTMQLSCPVPASRFDKIQLGHGSGGRMTNELIAERFMPRVSNDTLEQLGDAAIITLGRETLAMSTDTFVVKPLEFPGGDIGVLAIHGTVNDISMMAARPRYITIGFVLEEGLPMELLDRVVTSMAHAASMAGVTIVAGDTKVVERGKADGMFINTTGIGTLHPACRPGPTRAAPGDMILISGPIARHGMAVMAARGDLDFEAEITSDTANLYPMVASLADAFGDAIHVLRDPTRGGVASALNEIAVASKVGMVLEEDALPIDDAVIAACEMLGLDPLYVANEGTLVAIVRRDVAGSALEVMHTHALGHGAVLVGEVTDSHKGTVVTKTSLGGTRIVDLLPGEQLPRIC